MPSLLDYLNTLLTERNAATALAGPIGGSAEEAEAAIGPALARIIDGLATLAGDGRGAGIVRHLVDRHAGPQAEDLDEHLEQAPTESGNVILDRVFGAERGLVVIGLASALGLAPSSVGRLLPILAPLVTAELSRRRAAGHLDEQQVAKLLRGDQRAIAQAGVLDGTTFDGRRLASATMQRQRQVTNRDTPGKRSTTTIDLQRPGRSTPTGTLATLEASAGTIGTPTVADTAAPEPSAAVPVTDRPDVGGDGRSGDAEEPPPIPEAPDGEDAAVIEATDELVTEDAAVIEGDAVVGDGDTGPDAAPSGPSEEDEVKVAALAWLGWAVGAVVLVLLLAWLLSTCGAATEDDEAATVINVGGDARPTTSPVDVSTGRAAAPAAPKLSEEGPPTPTTGPGPSTTAGGEGPSGGSGSVTEAELQGAVDAILRDSGVTGVVDVGRVTLTGTAPDEESRDWIEANVSVLLGVSAIDNQVTIAPADDDDVARPPAPPAEDESTGAPSGEAETAAAPVPPGTTLNEALALQPVTFASGSPELTDEGRAVVAQVAAHLVANPTLTIEIGGHTDSDGDEEANLELSQDRAGAVRAELVAAGVAPDRLTAIGFGAAEPAVPNDSLDNKAINRRIDFTVR